MHRPKCFSLFLLLLLLTAALSVPAQLDPTFGVGGRVDTTVPGTQVTVKALLLPDGKIFVLTYSATSGQPQPVYKLVRYNSNGTIDTGYGTGGEAVLAIPFIVPCCNSIIREVIRQTDGKIVLVANDNDDGLIMRFNEDGSVDNSFSGDGIDRPNLSASSDGLHSVSQEANGKLLAVGGSSGASGGISLIRYNTDGTPDATFGNQGVVFHAVPNISEVFAGRQADGRLVVMANNKTYRFNSGDGSMDNTFSTQTLSASSFVQAFLVLSNDKILVGDSQTFTDQFQRPQSDIRLRRFNPDGTPDSGFGTVGSLSIDVSHNMPDRFIGFAQTANNSVVIAAQTDVERNRTAIGGGYLSLTTIDAAGAITGRSLTTSRTSSSSEGNGTTVLIQPDGKILVANHQEVLNDNQNFYDVFLTRHIGVPLTNYHFRAAPFDFGQVPSGMSRPGVLRPETNQWFLSGFTVNAVGTGSDIPVPSDYTRDFVTDVAYFRPSTGTWFIGSAPYTQNQNYTQVRWGTAGDIPVPFDHDGDGKSDIAVFRPSDGNWYVRHSSNTSNYVVHWGTTGDKPVTGDYDGDGFGDIAVFRPSDGNWYINRSSDGGATIVHFGTSEDIPVQEDYDGDGKTDIAVWRPSTGVWYIWRSTDGGFTIAPFGLSTDIPTPADYDNDKKADISVFRAGTWYQFLSTTNAPAQFPFGTATDIPLSGRN